MPLNLTKIAFGCASLSFLQERLAARGEVARLTTRYRPKRAAEIDGGSLYWIIANTLVARSPILGFEEAQGEAQRGRTDIVIAARAIPVVARPRRVHQGWRYLEQADAPPDFGDGQGLDPDMPDDMHHALARLGLV